jgi:hypothetical protein
MQIQGIFLLTHSFLWLGAHCPFHSWPVDKPTFGPCMGSRLLIHFRSFSISLASGAALVFSHVALGAAFVLLQVALGADFVLLQVALGASLAL